MPTRRHAALAEREELLGHLDEVDTERNRVFEILCRCPEMLGFTTTGECLLNPGDLSDADKECIADAFDGRENFGLRSTTTPWPSRNCPTTDETLTPVSINTQNLPQ